MCVSPFLAVQTAREGLQENESIFEPNSLWRRIYCPMAASKIAGKII